MISPTACGALFSARTTPRPSQNLVEPSWNGGGTLVEPSWNLTPGPPRTTRSLSGLSAVRENKHAGIPLYHIHVWVPQSDAGWYKNQARQEGFAKWLHFFATGYQPAGHSTSWGPSKCSLQSPISACVVVCPVSTCVIPWGGPIKSWAFSETRFNGVMLCSFPGSRPLCQSSRLL